MYCNEPGTNDPQVEDALRALHREPVSAEASTDKTLQLKLSWLSYTLRDNASADSISISITNNQILDILSSAGQVQHCFENPAPASSSARRKRGKRRRCEDDDDDDDENATRGILHKMIRRSGRGLAAKEGWQASM